MNKPAGLYIHIPFCLSKCPYCDFYSVPYSREKAALYAEAVIRNIKHYGGRYDTIYFGGGTPVLLYRHIGDILDSADITADAEITVEANPCMAGREVLDTLRSAGVNRLSLGVQSMNERELAFLGRRHTVKQTESAFANAAAAGFDNISADMMIGLEAQTAEDITHTAERLSELGASHISAYILKTEENTPFAERVMDLPDEGETAELYLHTVRELARLGFAQYEISNFARPGYKSRHNLKYWRCEEYLGIGAAAHSYLNGRRFCTERDIDAFISAPVQVTAVTDENAGGWEEYAMLKLRLTEGLTYAEAERFGKASELRRNASELPSALVNAGTDGISLTPEGFLVSNAVIGELLYNE